MSCLRDAMVAGADEVLERAAGEAFGLHLLDVLLGDAVVARPDHGLERRGLVTLGLDAADVVDGHAVALRALDLIERQLVVALGLEVADVARSDVVNGQLEAAPQRQVVGVADRLHLGDVLLAGLEREETGAAAVAEGAIEGERPGFAAELEFDARGGKRGAVDWQPGQLVGGEGLSHAPAAAVPVVTRPVGLRRSVGADLEEHLGVAELGGPRAVDRRSSGPRQSCR